MRPYRRAVAAIKGASTLAGLPQYPSVIDHMWLETVWHLACAAHRIKRVYLADHAAQSKQENLIVPSMHPRPGRKLKYPYQPSHSIP